VAAAHLRSPAARPQTAPQRRPPATLHRSRRPSIRRHPPPSRNPSRRRRLRWSHLRPRQRHPPQSPPHRLPRRHPHQNRRPAKQQNIRGYIMDKFVLNEDCISRQSLPRRPLRRRRRLSRRPAASKAVTSVIISNSRLWQRLQEPTAVDCSEDISLRKGRDGVVACAEGQIARRAAVQADSCFIGADGGPGRGAGRSRTRARRRWRPRRPLPSLPPGSCRRHRRRCCGAAHERS